MKKVELNKETINSYIDKAIVARKEAYAEYSKFMVGAIAIFEDGNIYQGANIENASYGLSICAERCAIFKGVSEGMRKLSVLCVVGDTSAPISPCGACRQVINEFSNEETIVILSNLKKEYKIFKVSELLPYDFKL